MYTNSHTRTNAHTPLAMRGWGNLSIHYSSHRTMTWRHRVQGDDEVQPMQVLQRQNTDDLPSSPPKFKLQLTKHLIADKARWWGCRLFCLFCFFFYFFPPFLGQLLSIVNAWRISVYVLKNKNKKPEYSNPSYLSPLQKHYSACGAQQQKDVTCV